LSTMAKKAASKKGTIISEAARIPARIITSIASLVRIFCPIFSCCSSLIPSPEKPDRRE